LLVKADHARYGGACQLPLRFAYSSGIRALPQKHASQKVGLESFEGPEEMIPNDHERMKPPAEARQRIAQHLDESLRRTRRRENFPPVITPVDHMVQRPLKLNSSLSRQRRTGTSKSDHRKPNNPDTRPDPCYGEKLSSAMLREAVF